MVPGYEVPGQAFVQSCGLPECLDAIGEHIRKRGPLPPDHGIGVAAYGWLIGAVLAGLLPARALLALLAALPSAQAARELLRYATQPRSLAPAIRKTNAAAALHGLLLAGALFGGG